MIYNEEPTTGDLVTRAKSRKEFWLGRVMIMLYRVYSQYPSINSFSKPWKVAAIFHYTRRSIVFIEPILCHQCSTAWGNSRMGDLVKQCHRTLKQNADTKSHVDYFIRRPLSLRTGALMHHHFRCNFDPGMKRNCGVHREWSICSAYGMLKSAELERGYQSKMRGFWFVHHDQLPNAVVRTISGTSWESGQRLRTV